MVLAVIYLIINFRNLKANQQAIENVEDPRLKNEQKDKTRPFDWRDWRILTGYLRSEKEEKETSSGKEAISKLQGIWSRYIRASNPWLSLLRALLISYVYYKAMGILFREFHPSHLLIRGDLTYEIYWWTGFVTRYFFFLIMFFAFDQAQNCSQLIRLFTEYVEEYVEEYVKDPSNIPMDKTDKFVKDARTISHIIAKRTECVSKLVLVPFFIWFLLILSRLHFFEAWDVGWLQGVARGFAAFICLVAAFTLHSSAKRYQQTLIDALDLCLRKSDKAKTSQQFQQFTSIREEIAKLRRGAFSPLHRLPIVRAVLWPFTGLGSLYLIPYLVDLF